MLKTLKDIRSGQSSPGNLHDGQEPSKPIWQMPQTSSSGMSQRHVATAAHFLIVTFMTCLLGIGRRASELTETRFPRANVD